MATNFEKEMKQIQFGRRKKELKRKGGGQAKINDDKNKIKSLQHPVFPGGLPSKY